MLTVPSNTVGTEGPLLLLPGPVLGLLPGGVLGLLPLLLVLLLPLLSSPPHATKAKARSTAKNTENNFLLIASSPSEIKNQYSLFFNRQTAVNPSDTIMASNAGKFKYFFFFFTRIAKTRFLCYRNVYP
jgi:hypothetical protein